MMMISSPSPAIQVSQQNQFSSVGILCQHSSGQRGVSACLHGTGEAGTTVTVDGRTFTVAEHNHVNDIVFIPIDDALFEHLSAQTRGHAGLRLKADNAPAQQEEFQFDGVTNANACTFAQSCDPWLFETNPHKQLRVQTTRDTDEGDSGCALIDLNDKTVGFAFQMTLYGQRPEFTDWIWAPNALDSLELTPSP